MCSPEVTTQDAPVFGDTRAQPQSLWHASLRSALGPELTPHITDIHSFFTQNFTCFNKRYKIGNTWYKFQCTAQTKGKYIVYLYQKNEYMTLSPWCHREVPIRDSSGKTLCPALKERNRIATEAISYSGKDVSGPQKNFAFCDSYQSTLKTQWSHYCFLPPGLKVQCWYCE